ncbi:putative RNA-dependent RNA polymerase 1 [Brachionus plicatilis]|uniref:RNA-dependent RNA polymerase n=1 Tax=Brachionus plicatilis TaxID=10195 RepID=A0A3M7PS07_BRAPC|nr:putative RNA-dependent RNA polymerase 1 [Brachionus plicatilis]
MSRPVIKLYPLGSVLSAISDEVIDSRKIPNLYFEFRDNIKLTPGVIYQILISSDREIKGQYEFEYKNCNIAEIKIFNENQILSRTSKSPFSAKLVDQNNLTIALGLFYRYRTSSSERSMNPVKWDPNFIPSDHLNYNINNSQSRFDSFLSETPKSIKSQNFFPTPDNSNSDISLHSIQSLKYSSNYAKNKINHSTPTSSYVSSLQKSFKFSPQKNSPIKRPKDSQRPALESICLTDNSSDDDDYSFANRTNLTSHFDSQSQISLDSKACMELFDSIESVSEINFPTKKKEKYFAFTLLFTFNNVDPNFTKIQNNVFISNLDKIFISNHAVRKLREMHNVRLIASFKVEIQETKAKLFKQELVDLLLNGIQVDVNGKREKIFFIGNSKSGMRERNFWAIDEQSFQKIDFQSFIFKMGNFNQFNSIEKLSKRYSQFFSSSRPSIILEKDQFYVIKDEISSENLCFTDGIGLMRSELCERISKILNLDYHCMIFQVRCGGFKGVLVGFPDRVFNNVLKANNLPLNGKTKVIFRESQQKFDSNSLELNIVSWSSFNSTPASLNSEFLMVLDGLSKSPQLKNYIISLFKDYLNDLDESLINPQKAVSKLFNSNDITEFTHKYKMILLACRKNLAKELDPKQYKIIRNLIIEQHLFSLIAKKKINIQIEKSRHLIGILDETGTLDQDEVFVSYRDQSGKIQFLSEQFCIVGRNPCYGLSEIRKVRTKFVPELQHLENCIVFPKKGTRPLTNILSGGDLDGDFYFVSWDEILTNIDNSEKLIDYPESQDFSSYVKIKNLRNQLAEFYAKQVVNEDGIGLWHYYLTCLYDQDRQNMLDQRYLNAVLEINKCIDGVSSGERQMKWVKKPDWFLSTQELKGLDGMNKEEKFCALAEILDRKNLDLEKVDQNIHRFSLLGCLAAISIKKYLKLISQIDQPLYGQFLSDDEIEILSKNKKINLNISKQSIRLENLKMIRQEYSKFVMEVKKLDGKIKEDRKQEIKLFTGMFEKQAKKEAVSKKEQQKIGLINKFRNFVVNLKYSDRELDDENYVNSVYCLDGYHFRSRVVTLYLDLKDEEIPWMFYDILCYLKNYCNNKICHKVSLALPDLTPFSLATECTNVFSATKLSNFNKV